MVGGCEVLNVVRVSGGLWLRLVDRVERCW
jgi:hypothetical protein